MPRPKKEGAPEPKRRSRHGCWPCKTRKIKCGEEKPHCVNCQRANETCDYSIRLNWEARSRKQDDHSAGTWSITEGTHKSISPAAFPHSPRNTHKSTPPPGETPPQVTLNLFATRDVAPPPGQKSPPFLHPQSQHLQSPRKHNLYPSPSASTNDSPGYSGNDRSQYPMAPMPPPQESTLHRHYSDGGSEDRSKRRKLSPGVDRTYSPPLSFNGSVSGSYYPESRPSITSNPNVPGPLTPSSEDGLHRPAIKQSPSTQSASLDTRRLSVKSLLSNPEDDFPTSEYGSQTAVSIATIDPQSPIMYGFDQGFPDLDLPKNDDEHALAMASPSLEHKHMMGLDGVYDSPSYGEFGFGLLAKSPGFEKGGYYAQPVPVKIPSNLMPLPSRLSENPMNLLYFHHFLNHTARILVPHDCADNPFRKILPQLAISNVNLLNLLLAYSASHRARLLNHREPSNRIALWVRDVFPSLRHALSSNTNEQISDANLATAIMLASLEIISPNVFEVTISWQEHLQVARQMIIRRGGLKSLHHRQDNVSYFLSRWFAYLDVVGSLSGANYSSTGRSLWLYADDDESAKSPEKQSQNYEIDCLLGFTSHCVTILAKVADLAKRCDAQRLAPDGTLRPNWKPSANVVAEADRLKADLRDARSLTPSGCSHDPAPPLLPSANNPFSTAFDAAVAPEPHHFPQDADEMTATNDAFHWAGSIHLSRRVLGKPTHDPEVQMAVREIVRALDRVRPGGTAEACLVFPMFTAGCEALEIGVRRKILERVRGVEGIGMAQVHKARTLMERVWATGKPWEALVAGEFFG